MTVNIVYQYRIRREAALKQGKHDLPFDWVVGEIAAMGINRETVKNRLREYLKTNEMYVTDRLDGGFIKF